MKSVLRTLAASLLLMCVTMPATAQKKTTPSGEKAIFVGVINYGDKYSKKSVVSTPNKTAGGLDVDGFSITPDAAAAPVREVGLQPLCFYANEKMSTVDQGSAFATMWGDDVTLQVGVAEEESALRGELPIEKFYLEDDFELKEINALILQNRYSEAISKMSPFYKRLGDTKKICDLTCVKYTIVKGRMAGKDIWVCEDYLLAHYMAPFWGMVFPVMEADFCLPFDGLRPYHVTAVSVDMGASAVNNIVTKALPIHNAAIEEVLSRFLMEPHRYNH